jgi:hypothetical protein
MAAPDALRLSSFCGDPYAGTQGLVLAGETDRSMGVRFLGDLRPRRGPGLGASPPGIGVAVSARTEALENARKSQ